MLVWVKNSFVLGRQDYQWQHEPCLYGWTPGAGHYFTTDRTEATVLDNGELDISKMSKAELKDTLLRMLADTPSSVIRENKPARNAEHPTMKPLKLLAHAVRNSSRKGEIVLDTFAGSGSTLMTCEQMRRQGARHGAGPAVCRRDRGSLVQIHGRDGQPAHGGRAGRMGARGHGESGRGKGGMTCTRGRHKQSR